MTEWILTPLAVIGAVAVVVAIAVAGLSLWLSLIRGGSTASGHHSHALEGVGCLTCLQPLRRTGGDDQTTDYRCPGGHLTRASADLAIRIRELDDAPCLGQLDRLAWICRECGCTDEDCSGCIERTGRRCYWVAPNLCSACFEAKADLSSGGHPSSDEAA